MAGEVKIVASITVSGGVASGSRTLTLDWTAAKGAEDKIISIGTSEEALSFTDIGTNGYIICWNTDPTNYVEMGYTSGSAYGTKLVANGGVAVFQLNTGNTVYAKANTAACRIRCLHVGG